MKKKTRLIKEIDIQIRHLKKEKCSNQVINSLLHIKEVAQETEKWSKQSYDNYMQLKKKYETLAGAYCFDLDINY